MPSPELFQEDHEDRKVLGGLGIRLIFTRADDRWTHALVRSEDDASPLVQSLETDTDPSDDSTIVSPVYQEIQPHDLRDRPGSPLCVLLTGRHFDHQFSAVVTFAVDPDRPGGVVIDWDVADRCRKSVSHLAATYQLPLGSGDLTDAGSNSIGWSGDRVGHGMLEFIAGPPESLALAEAGRNGTRVQAVANVAPSAFTHRLRYRWRWSSGVDPAD